MTDTSNPNPATDTAVREYVQALLRIRLVDEQARQERIRGLEKTGHRIVNGGQTSSGSDDQQTWEITDWRTEDLLASGTGSYEAYDAAVRRLDPAGKWVHVDTVDEDPTEPAPAGIPTSLADALQDWVGTTSTPDEEVAEFVGWSVEEVALHREEV